MSKKYVLCFPWRFSIESRKEIEVENTEILQNLHNTFGMMCVYSSNKVCNEKDRWKQTKPVVASQIIRSASMTHDGSVVCLHSTKLC